MKSCQNETLSKLLVSLNAPLLKEFTHRCADEVCGRRGPSFEALQHAVEWTPGQFQEAMSGVKNLLTDAVRHDYSITQVEVVLDILDNEQIQGIMSCISVRRDELKECILAVTANTPGSSLVDFDWKLKWTMGSSSLTSLQEPLLCMDLSTVQHSLGSKHDEHNTVCLELNKEELGTLISALESVEESLPQ